MRFFFLLLICVFWFMACGSQIKVLSHLGDEEEDRPVAKKNCLKKTLAGKTICVQQKTQNFYIKSLNNKAVDFVFVLDVSDSMLEDLSRLGQAFSFLISHIKDSDWRMFFTTADHGDYRLNTVTGGMEALVGSHQSWRDYKGKKPYFGRFMDLEYQGKTLNQKELNAGTPDFAQVFQDSLTRKPGEDCLLAPYCQGPLEQPLQVLNSVFERWAEEETYAKPSADFVSFIVTDEDERAEDQDQALTADKVLAGFKKLFPQKSFYSFAFLIQDEDCLIKQKKHSPSSQYGKKVSELARLTGGKNISLCEADYGPSLRDISALLKNLIESVKLASVPVLPGEIQVEFIKGPARPDFRLEGNKLVFHPALEPGTELKVSYFVESR